MSTIFIINYFHNTPLGTNHNSNILTKHASSVSLKTLSQKNLVRQKIDQQGKIVQSTPYRSSEMNNLNLATCYTNTYANQSLYTNLVNNFARFGVSVYVSLT